MADPITAVVAALVSGTAVGAYQNYRRRSRPFVVTTEVATTLSTGHDTELPQNVVTTSAQSSLLPLLSPRSSLDRIHHARVVVRDALALGPPLVAVLDQSIAALKESTNAASVADAIHEPLESGFFDDMLAALALHDRPLNLARPAEDAETKVKVFRLDDKNGSYSITLPGHGGWRFMKDLNQWPMIEEEIRPFVSAIEGLDSEALRRSLSIIRERLDREISRARQIEAALEERLRENSLWTMRLYVANYGETAMFILPKATLQVRRVGASDLISARTQLDIPTDGGRLRQEDTGLLIPAGEARELAFTTVDRQVDMTDGLSRVGDEIRGRWQSGNSECRLTFEYVSASLRARKRGRTKWHAFREA